MPQTRSTLPTTRSGTVRAHLSTTKCRKTLDSDQLAAKRLKTQGKVQDDNDEISDDNNADSVTDPIVDDEDLVPVKGGQGGHKARKQRNRVQNQ